MTTWTSKAYVNGEEVAASSFCESAHEAASSAMMAARFTASTFGHFNPKDVVLVTVRDKRAA